MSQNKAAAIIGSPSRNDRATVAFLLIGMVVISLITICLGHYSINLITLVKVIFSKFIDIEKTWNTTVETVVFQVRLPRVGVALLVGACLASSGASFQGVFRNPLVSPFILGVSAGAGFGAALAILAGGNALMIHGSAFAFGALAVVIAIGLSRVYSSNQTLVLVLSGIIIGAVFTALLALTKYVADPDNKLPVIEYWLLGSLAATRATTFFGLAAITVPALCLMLLLRWRLNLLAFGDDTAQTLGVNVPRERLIHIALSTVVASAAVSVCGIVGWVGLVVPHMARMLVGPDHSRLLPVTMLLGGIFLLIVDTLARTMSQAEIPLGIVTALLGAPVFAILLRRGERSWM